MFYQFSRQNTFVLALIVLFSAICLLPMNLSADHDNLYIHDVAAQTSVSISYYDPDVESGAYANILNFSDVRVRYYYYAELIVHKERSTKYWIVSDSDKGSVNPGGSISFLPYFQISMTGKRRGRYIATSKVELGLKFDFDGDGVFDDGAMVSSSEEIKFKY